MTNAKRSASREYNRRVRHEQTLAVALIKSNSRCEHCGNSYPAVCMDFDHRDGEVKVEQISTMVANNWSWKDIQAEIAKCDLLCANCHRLHTHERGQHMKGRVEPETTQLSLSVDEPTQGTHATRAR